MRKAIFIVALFLTLSFAAKAQADLRAESTSGDFAVELTMTPFTGDEAWISPGYLKARYFTMVDVGARLSLGTGMLFSTDKGARPESVHNYSFIDIRPGAEYYLSRSGQVLPFVGADFIMQFQRANLDKSVGLPIGGAWDIDPDVLQNRSFNAFGFSLFAGGDYYLRGGGFFIGTEIGFEFIHQTNKEVKIGDDLRFPETTKATFRPQLTSSLRIGVAF